MIEKARTYLSFVRFSHSVFALPFALTGALLASREHPVTWRHIVWIVVCMITARSAAMGFNRLVDARFDAANPRTASREIPSGRMSITEATAFVLFMSAAFVAAAGQLSRLCLFLSPVALVLIFWYSLAKRYTWATQLFLGLAMAIAPVGGWLAARRRRRMGAVAARSGHWVVGRRVRRALRLPGPRRRSAAALAIDSSAIRDCALTLDLSRDAHRDSRMPRRCLDCSRVSAPCISSVLRSSPDSLYMSNRWSARTTCRT